MYFDTRIKYVKNYKANTVVKVKLTLFTRRLLVLTGKNIGNTTNFWQSYSPLYFSVILVIFDEVIFDEASDSRFV
jgi:hypothetical protein